MGGLVMEENMWYCLQCRNDEQDKFDLEKHICAECGSSKIVCYPKRKGTIFKIARPLPDEDWLILTQLSNDPDFFQAMIDLRKNDIITYTEKMGSFRQQWNDKLAKIKAADNANKPHCPNCNSTNIKKISSSAKVAGALAFGLFSKTAKSQFKCNDCGYKW